MTAVQFRNPEVRLSEALESTPAVGIILLCIGMAERDGVVILLGHLVTLLAAVFVGTLLYFAAKAGSDPMAAWEKIVALAASALALAATSAVAQHEP